MFIELSEFLRCPEAHPQTHCVILPHRMEGRDVVEGMVGCPACHREYPISGGVVRFGSPPSLADPGDLPEPAAASALLGISSTGGNVVFAGSAAKLVERWSGLVEGVHAVGINAPPDVRPGARLTLLESAATIPLRSAMARGVVLGEEYAAAPWTNEAARVVLPGLRVVVLREQVEVAGLQKLAEGKGMWVGAKRPPAD